MNGKIKSASTKELIGIDYDLFHLWIRYQTPYGYNMTDVGKNIHLDHRILLSAFDLTDAEQQKKTCTFVNIKPVLAYENLRKKDKVDISLYHKQLVNAQFFMKNIANYQLL